jgi:hypothetical protein
MKNRTIRRDELRHINKYAKQHIPVVVHDRPENLAECPEDRCPWVSCQYHLYLDVGKRGELIMNHPDKDPLDLEEPCALRVAARGSHNLNQIGKLLSVTRERIRQIERDGLVALAKRVRRMP